MKKIFTLLLIFVSANAFSTGLSLNDSKLENIKVTISVAQNEQIYWNSEKVTLSELDIRLKNFSDTNLSKVVDLRGDGNVRYQRIAQVLYLILSQKNLKLNFVIQQ